MLSSTPASNCSNTICLPAHILDAPITPRAREVLMLLASQTSAETPALWIWQTTIATRLRCSPSTVARAIQKLVLAKLIAETGQLHEGRYKVYHVRWTRDENMKAVSKKITKPIHKIAEARVPPKSAPRPIEKVAEPVPASRLSVPPLLLPSAPPPQQQPQTLMPQALLKDSRIAYFAEIAKKRHQENHRLHQSILLKLRLQGNSTSSSS